MALPASGLPLVAGQLPLPQIYAAEMTQICGMTFLKNCDTQSYYKINRQIRMCQGGGVFHAFKADCAENEILLTEDEITIKCIQASRISEMDDDPWAEIRALSRIRAQNYNERLRFIVDMLECLQDDQQNLFIVSEFCNRGPLIESLTKVNVREIFKDLVEGVLEVHQAGICHHDLSPENIMLCFDPELQRVVPKIIDFGMSMAAPLNGHGQAELVTPPGARGKIPYMSPEMFMNQAQQKPFDGFKADIFSLGCILLVMVLNHPTPWAIPHPGDKNYSRICEQGDIAGFLQEQNFEVPVPNRAMFFELASALLRPNPDQRPSAREILDHGWLQ